MTYCLSKLGIFKAEHGWHSTGQEKTGTHKMLIALSGVLSIVCPVPYDPSLLGPPMDLSPSVSDPPFLSTRLAACGDLLKPGFSGKKVPPRYH